MFSLLHLMMQNNDFQSNTPQGVIYKNNTSPLCLLFFHDNRKKSVGLGVSVVRSCWDAQAQKVTDDCPDRDDIQFQITAKIKEYEKKN